MATAFVALNHVFGHLFDVSEAEAADPRGRPSAPRHFNTSSSSTPRPIRAGSIQAERLVGVAVFAAEHWNPALTELEKTDLYYYKFENYVRQISSLTAIPRWRC